MLSKLKSAQSAFTALLGVICIAGMATANAASFIVGANGSLTTSSVSSSSGSFAGLQAQGFSSSFDEEFVEGDAFANGDGNTDFFFSNMMSPPGFPGATVFYDMFVSANGDGSADLFPGSLAAESTAEVIVESIGLLVLDNTSADDTYEITYDFFAFLGASAIGGPEEPADAFADAFIELRIDGSLVHSFSIFADLLFGPPDDFLDIMEEITVTLGPSESVEIELITGVAGFATVVPVPAALPLMGSALLGLFGLARRRASRA